MIGLLAGGLIAATTVESSAQATRERPNQRAAQQGWSSNYQEALATARRLDKPLMVVFRCVP